MKIDHLKIYVTLSMLLLIGTGCSRISSLISSPQASPSNLEPAGIDTRPIILIDGTPLADGVLNKTHVFSQSPCPDPFPEVTVKVPVDTVALTEQAINRTPDLVEQPPESYSLSEKSNIINAPQMIKPDEPFTLSFNCQDDDLTQHFLTGVLIYEPTLKINDLPLDDLIYTDPVEIRFNINVGP
ncbi:hypothetical protein KKF05_03205 [Patescibacteria group bacterium]|nr:hypothetical protein [Patescibacteria group bacterium]MBU1028863.1 hypothetical protein [Patescibacteria group bacterium]MBU1915768.1 hypothetical protein [Patescibacteria group bacterium]